MFNKKLNSKIEELEEKVESLEARLREHDRETQALLGKHQLMLDEFRFEDVTKALVELSHKLKKIEEFLEIEYVVEPPDKLFIGYKKK